MRSGCLRTKFQSKRAGYEKKGRTCQPEDTLIFTLICFTIVILGLLTVGGFAKGGFGRWLAPYLACVTGGVVLVLVEVLLIEYLMTP
jgi:hypothetical protein